MENEKIDHSTDKPIVGNYVGIPDHSDLRGFSYKAPERFDPRDEQRRGKGGFWQRILSRIGKGGRA